MIQSVPLFASKSSEIFQIMSNPRSLENEFQNFKLSRIFYSLAVIFYTKNKFLASKVAFFLYLGYGIDQNSTEESNQAIFIDETQEDKSSLTILVNIFGKTIS